MVVDERKAAEGAAWLSQIEEENAGELTPERIAAMEAAAAAEEAGADGTALPMAGDGGGSPAAWSWARTNRPPRAAASPGRRGFAGGEPEGLQTLFWDMPKERMQPGRIG